MKLKTGLEIFVTALLLHVVLILISFIEVFIYSMAIVTGKDEAFYARHAEISGPWVSGIFGFILIFLLVRRFIKRHSEDQLLFAVGLPILYILLDFLILFAMGMDWWSDLRPIIFLANGAKILGALLSYVIFRR